MKQVQVRKVARKSTDAHESEQSTPRPEVAKRYAYLLK